MGILSGTRVALTTLVRGKADFPGRGRFSRVATRSYPRFNKDWISRENLQANYNVAIAKLSPDNQAVFFQTVISHNLLLPGQAKKLSRLKKLPTKLEHYHFRKALIATDIKAFVIDLNQAIEGLGFSYDNMGRFKVEEPRPIKPEPQIEPDFLKNQVLEVLKDENRPLQLKDLKEKLKQSGISVSSKIFNQLFREMFINDGSVGRASGYEKNYVFYVKANEKELIKAQLLCSVTSQNGETRTYTNRRLQWGLEKGEIVILWQGQAPTYCSPAYISNYLAEKTTPYLTEKSRVFIHNNYLQTMQVKEKLLWGLKEDGQRVAVQNTAVCRKRHHDLLVNYEKKRLKTTLQNRNLNSFLASQITDEAKAQKQPTYFLIYRTRKLLEMGVSIDLALLSIHCDGKTDSDSLLAQYQEISAWDFDINIRSRHYIENFMGSQRQVTDKLDVLRLFLANRIAQLVYQNETMDDEKLGEIRFLCAPAAEQYGFDRLSEQFKDIYLMNTNPEKYLEAAKIFYEATRMTKLEAVKYLGSLAQEQKIKICDWLDLTPEEVSVYFRPKSIYSIAIKERQIMDFLGLRIVLNCQEENAHESEYFSIEKLKELKPILEQEFQATIIKDHIEQARPSGWRALKIYGQSANRRIEVIAQTEEMYRLEKQAEMSQVHWARDINKEPGIKQEFDPLPREVALQLGGNPDENFQALKQHDQEQYVHVFVGTLVDEEQERVLLDVSRLTPNHLKSLRLYPKRLPKAGISNPLLEDVFCRSAQTAGYNLRAFGQAELFRFTRNRKGKTTLVRQTSPQVKNGQLIVFYRERKTTVSALSVMQRLGQIYDQAIYYSTKFRAWQERRETALSNSRNNHPREYPEKIKSFEQERQKLSDRGKTIFTGAYHEIVEDKKNSAQYQDFEDLNKIMGIIANTFRFNNPQDLLVAIGLDIVELDHLKREIDNVIDNTGYRISYEFLSDTQVKLTISAPDAKGIIYNLFTWGIIEPANLVSLSTQSFFSGDQQRVEMELVINIQSDSFSQGESRGELIGMLNSLQVEQISDTTTTQIFRPQIDILTLGIHRQETGSWLNFDRLIESIQAKPGFDITQVTLDANQDQGMVRIEVPSAVLENEESKKALFNKLENLGLDIEEAV